MDMNAYIRTSLETSWKDAPATSIEYRLHTESLGTLPWLTRQIENFTSDYYSNDIKIEKITLDKIKGADEISEGGAMQKLKVAYKVAPGLSKETAKKTAESFNALLADYLSNFPDRQSHNPSQRSR